jgi:tellurite resistance protein TerC
MTTYFPFADYWWFYLGFTGFILLLLALDLGVFHRRAHAVSFREASLWSAVWIALALVFNFLFYRYAAWEFARDPRLLEIPGFEPEAAARQVGLEFLAGYVVEKTLSLDNIFVFVVVFAFFGIPALYQHRVLFYGIAGALVFRALFIALGAALFDYQWIVWLFGGFLILTGVKMMFAPDRGVDPSANPLLRLFRRFVSVTAELEGQRFFVRRKGVWQATPLLLALLFVEISDILFAIDSVPAIFALTREPMIVFTSNVFAILGLRALYFLLAGAVERFTLLKYGLAAVLVFVGLKMVWLNHAFDGHFPIGWSLAIIGGILAVSVAVSLAAGRDRRASNSEKGVEQEHEVVLEDRHTGGH